MRRSGMVPWVLGLALLVPSAAHSFPREGVGSLVSVGVEIEGETAPLYAAPDRSGRFYVEALPKARYALRLGNNTNERLGVVIAVDGLNVISGDRDPAAEGRQAPIGQMYVLSPRESITVRGWRTSLDEVRRFTFVDEQRSYATRSGKANAKMGWIELAVYRERYSRPDVSLGRGREIPPPQAKDDAEERDQAAPPAAEAPAAPDSRGQEGMAEGGAGRRAEAPRSYPGTGWGDRSDDAATLVDFDPQPRAGERVTLRYEYASGLRALGIDVRSGPYARNRLRERDRGEGFAKPPAW